MHQRIKIVSSIVITAILLSASATFNGVLDLNNLFNYEDQYYPEQAQFHFNDINPLTDIGATLGRVLFYDKKLSVNNTTACASCHQQENAFGDTRSVATGFEGQATLRHPMRLVNVDFGSDNHRFWDERVRTLENLTTLPIQDTIEMGFSGINGYPGIDSLLSRLQQIAYYRTLFELTFGDEEITEKRIGDALAQFIRSIMIFDSRFDEGYAMVGNEVADFPNFTDEENLGKRLFFNFPFNNPDDLPQLMGAGCGFCHKAPGLAILHLTDNNGVIGVAGDSTAIDLTITRSPSLKGLVKPDGSSNGPFMHDGSLKNLDEVIDHYNEIPFNPLNTNLAGLLFPDPDGSVNLNLSEESKAHLKAFLLTLSGSEIYTHEKWSNPFDENGNITLLDSINCDEIVTQVQLDICEGENFEGYCKAGIYRDTFTSASLCDSIRVLELNLIPTILENEFIQLCEGNEYQGITEAGVYTFTEIGSNNCDSLFILTVDILPTVIDTQLIAICEGLEYLGFSETGNYQIIETGENGCDSVIELDLIVLPESDPNCSPSSTHELQIFPIEVEQILFDKNISGKVGLPGKYEFYLFNAQGKKIIHESRQLTSTFELQTPMLDSGIYFLNVNYKNQRLTFKLIRL